MKKNKITFLKEKMIEKIAEDNYSKLAREGYVENPIVNKLLAFQKTKQSINPKDLL